MSKILIIANDESTIYNFRREILRSFHAQGYVIILCMPKGEHTQEIEECGCSVIDVQMSRHGTNPLNDLKFMNTCRKLIKAHKPDVVLTYTVKPNIYGSIACQLCGVPYINNVTGLGSVLQNESPLARLLLMLQKFAYRKSSCVFFQNEENRKTLCEKGVVGKKVYTDVLPGSGVNLDLHAFAPMRAEDGTTRFIIVSRIRQDKGYNEFFAAAEIVKAKHPDTEFHVVGWYEDENYQKRVEALKNAGVIIYHGKQVQEEVHRLVSECDCLVHPSYHEGMANVLLEAAAAGRPVIATRIPGCKEAFNEGETGFGCEAGDTASLVDAMERMINTAYPERVQMGRLAREKMEREFDRQFVAQKYINRIESIIGGKQ